MFTSQGLSVREIDFKKRSRMGCRIGMNLVERLDDWTHPDPITGCWWWSGTIGTGGHAQIGLFVGARYRVTSAVKVNYVRFVGDVPRGMVVRHKCDQALCVNPDHLEIGTQRDNVQDMLDRGRHRPGRGERNVHSVLNDDAIRAMRVLWATGQFNFSQLGRAFRVNYKTVGRVVSGEGWSHVH